VVGVSKVVSHVNTNISMNVVVCSSLFRLTAKVIILLRGVMPLD
jgi:hypothetical protein